MTKMYEPHKEYSWKMEAKHYSLGNGFYQLGIEQLPIHQMVLMLMKS